MKKSEELWRLIFQSSPQTKALSPFSFHSIYYSGFTLPNISFRYLIFMISSSDNVFQSFEHTALSKLKIYSVRVPPFECHPTLRISSTDVDRATYQTQEQSPKMTSATAAHSFKQRQYNIGVKNEYDKDGYIIHTCICENFRTSSITAIKWHLYNY